MQKINWEMMTQFVFPEQLGAVEEVLSVEIKPIWQQIETEDSVRLVGIYHIAAIARFNPDELPEYSDGTFVEELEFEGNNGYFEYALPLEVDLPRDKVAVNCLPEVAINDVSHFVYDGSNCTFRWDVDCQFEEMVEGGLFQVEGEAYPYEQQSVLAVQQPPIPERPPIQEAVTLPAFVPDEVIEQLEEPPLIEVAPSFEDFQQQEQPSYTEEIHFGGDGIFPEQPVVSVEENVSPETVTEGQPSLEVEGATNETDVQLENANRVESPSYEVSNGSVVENMEEPVLEKKERVLEAKNQYFPTDADEFYNELTESYTILNVSNKVFRE